MRKHIALIAVAVGALGVSPALVSAGDDDGRVRARATADGSQEVTPNESAMTADVRVEIDDGELDIRVRVRHNTGTIVAAHIHCAAPGANGPVGVDLGVAPFTATKGTLVRNTLEGPLTANGCGWASPADVAAAIEAGAAYVNIHTMLIPSGEIRADLSARQG